MLMREIEEGKGKRRKLKSETLNKIPVLKRKLLKNGRGVWWFPRIVQIKEEQRGKLTQLNYSVD
jgi:hypothetical protein